MKSLHLIVATAALLDTTLLRAEETVERWRWRPSGYAFGSVEHERGVPPTFGGARLTEVSPAVSLGLALDADRRWDRAGFDAALVGLARSPFEARDRSYFLSGRAHAFRQLGDQWRLTLDDAAKLLRRPALGVSNFESNAASLGAEWSPSRGPAWQVRLEDRRRTTPREPSLGYALQSVGVGPTFSLGSRVQVQAEAAAQRYSAVTASGRRFMAAVEVAHVRRRGAATLRYELYEPSSDRLKVAPSVSLLPNAFPEPLTDVFGSRAAYESVALQHPVQDLAVAATDGELIADSVLLDPLLTGSEEWDFGRHKHVLLAYVSQRLGERVLLSGHLRYQRWRGPDLVIAVPGSYRDDRLELRAALHWRLTPRATLLLYAAHLTNDSDRGRFDFGRTLAVVGIQIH
jgi:hypothetical protein